MQVMNTRTAVSSMMIVRSGVCQFSSTSDRAALANRISDFGPGACRVSIGAEVVLRGTE